MKERRNRRDKARPPIRLETRRPRAEKPRRREPAGGRPAVDLDLLAALRAWAGARGERATEDALSKTPQGQRFRLRGGLDRIFRHYARLSWLIRRQGAEVTPDLVWGAASVALAGVALEDVAKSIAVTSRDIPRLAGLLGRIGNEGLAHPEMPEDVRLECPPDLFGRLSAAYGKGLAAELAALNMSAPIDIRINPLKAEDAAVTNALAEAEITLAPTPFAPLARRAKGHPDLAATPAFISGQFEIQDEGSQIVALLSGAQPGQQVLDFCAGAGGKSLAIAAAMKNRGHLVAADTNAKRLTRAKLRFKRAGVENAERIALTGKDDDPFLKRRANWFDRVLVDAPCSGTGAWRRHPETKWRGHTRLAELVVLQAAILARAARLTKRGGRLIYATCSLLPVENEERAEAFLAANPNFRLIEAAAVWTGLLTTPWPCAQRRFLKLTPAQHGTDGFFAAIFERES